MSKRIAVLCSGGGTNLQALIDAVEAGTIDGQIVLVLANASKAFANSRARATALLKWKRSISAVKSAIVR